MSRLNRRELQRKRVERRKINTTVHYMQLQWLQKQLTLQKHVRSTVRNVVKFTHLMRQTAGLAVTTVTPGGITGAQVSTTCYQRRMNGCVSTVR